jgi:hypothetical protein
MREQAPVGPIQRTQRQLVREDHERRAVAANVGLAGFGLRRSVQRPTQGMAALRALPAGDVWSASGVSPFILVTLFSIEYCSPDSNPFRALVLEHPEIPTA